MKLTNENIASCTEQLTEYYRNNKINNKTIIQNTFSLEEFLIMYKERFGEDYEFEFKTYKKFGSHHAKVEIKGERYNPTDLSEVEDDSFESTYLSSLGKNYRYSYSKGKNCIDFVTEKHRMPPIANLGISIALGIGLGLITKYVLPENVARIITEEIVTPLSDTFVGLLNALVGPVVFFSVVVSTIGVGDVSSFKKYGSKVLRKMFLLSLFIYSLSVIVPVILSGVCWGGDSYSPFYIIRDSILQIVPNNIVTPVLNNSILQLLFWGTLIGVGLLSIEKQNSGLSDGLSIMNEVFGKIMTYLGGFLPFYIFASIFTMVCGEYEFALGGSGKSILYYFIGVLSALVIMPMLTWIIAKVNPWKLIKNSFANCITGGSACSSLLVLNGVIEDLSDEKKFGIDKNKARFVAPVSQALFKPLNSICYFAITLGIIEISQPEVSVSSILTLFALCFILGIATPPCACGGMAVVAILLESLNLDPIYLAPAVAIDLLFDYLTTFETVLGNYVSVLLTNYSKKKSK